MGDWPNLQGLPRAVNVNGDNSEYCVPVYSSASANTKGSWTELSASAPFDVGMIMLSWLAEYYSGEALLDLGIGAPGSEQVIIANIGGSVVASNFFNPWVYTFPLAIPAGTRISARVQSTYGSASDWRKVSLILFQATSFFQSFQKVTTYGAATADSGGTSIDPGSVAGTKGAWVEIAAAVENTRNFLFCIGNQGNIARSSAYWALDLGIGASGSEQVLVADYPLSLWGSNIRYIKPTVSPVFPIPIPAGSRVAVRAKSTITDATDRTFDVILYGIG